MRVSMTAHHGQILKIALNHFTINSTINLFMQVAPPPLPFPLNRTFCPKESLSYNRFGSFKELIVHHHPPPPHHFSTQKVLTAEYHRMTTEKVCLKQEFPPLRDHKKTFMLWTFINYTENCPVNDVFSRVIPHIQTIPSSILCHPLLYFTFTFIITTQKLGELMRKPIKQESLC